MGGVQDSEEGITGIMGYGSVLAKFDDLDVEGRYRPWLAWPWGSTYLSSITLCMSRLSLFKEG